MLRSRYVEELQPPSASEKDRAEFQRMKEWYDAYMNAWKNLLSCGSCTDIVASLVECLPLTVLRLSAHITISCVLGQQQDRLGRQSPPQYHLLCQGQYRMERHTRNHPKRESMLEGSQRSDVFEAVCGFGTLAQLPRLWSWSFVLLAQDQHHAPYESSIGLCWIAYSILFS